MPAAQWSTQGSQGNWRDGELKPTLSFQVADWIHQSLEDTAAAEGRTISEEIERRLLWSYETDAQFGNRNVHRLAMLIGLIVTNLEGLLGAPWTAEARGRAAARKAVGAVLDTFEQLATDLANSQLEPNVKTSLEEDWLGTYFGRSEIESFLLRALNLNRAEMPGLTSVARGSLDELVLAGLGIARPDGQRSPKKVLG